ncbi:hypothetical protein JTB14_008112 [Gonioctena quinquepunctata]|nr:hypothetical protein JTB14_008112 [Gonioctena quinquepunctata]
MRLINQCPGKIQKEPPELNILGFIPYLSKKTSFAFRKFPPHRYPAWHNYSPRNQHNYINELHARRFDTVDSTVAI